MTEANPEHGCPRCLERGRPPHFGSTPRCAFETGVFSPENWMCATLIDLRNELVEQDKVVYADDNRAALIPCRSGEGFIVIVWYKSRGCTSRVTWLNDDEHAPQRSATLEEVEYVLEDLQR